MTCANLDEFAAREREYWKQALPSYLWRSDWVLGRAVIVYQILYTDVSDHLPEYATLKAMGYSDAYLIGVIIQESLLLAVLGFVPGFCSRLDFTPLLSPRRFYRLG